MSDYRGALHRLGVLTRQEVHLLVYDDALVLAVSHDAAALLSAAIGLGLGQRVAQRLAERAGRRSPQDMADDAAENRFIALDSIESASLRKTAGGLYRQLEVTFADGSREVLKWQRGDNKDGVAVPLLRGVLGNRLTVTWEKEPSLES